MRNAQGYVVDKDGSVRYDYGRSTGHRVHLIRFQYALAGLVTRHTIKWNAKEKARKLSATSAA